MAQINLIALIKAKQAQLARLERELDEARSALAGIVNSRRWAAHTTRAKAMRRLRRSAKRLTASPTAEATAQVLRAAQRPLHVNAIQKRLKARGLSVRIPTLVSTLSRWVRSRAVFYREKPNVFGLLERRRKR